MPRLALRDIAKGITHLLYPALCDGCRRPLVQGEQVLCISCSRLMPVTRHHHLADNDTALRFAGRVPFIRATSYAWFTADGLLQHLLHGLKYRGRKDIGRYLGSRFGNELRQLPAGSWTEGMDCIIPVPLHRAKEARRGYNQSLHIARGMSAATGIPIADGLLLRTRDTLSQTHKTRIERVENMHDAFMVIPGSGLTGKHVLLVDDVLTTGATIESCSRALLQQPGTSVSIATIGIAVS